MRRRFDVLLPLVASVLALSAVAPAGAQPVPDAGRVQRDTVPQPLPAPKPQVPLDLSSPQGEPPQPGGASVTIEGVNFSGNALLGSDVLLAAVRDLLNKPLDLAGLRSIAERVTERYRVAGYPFARGYLLPQEIKAGVLQVGVVEGRYGRIDVVGDERLAPLAAPFLATLAAGDPIASVPLERRLLVLADQPGVAVSALIRSGAAEGEGDLQVTVSRAARMRFDLATDNYGSRYTGEHRLRLDAEFDSPFGLGDQFVLRGIVSDEDLWLGSLGYGRTIGASGLRASLSFSRTAYELGDAFAALGASGTADVTAVSTSYPLIRTPTANLGLSATVQRKVLRDELRVVDTNERKSSWSVPIGVQFDNRGETGSLTYGALSFTIGQLSLRGDALKVDSTSGRNAEGGFRKWNLDIARLQPFGQSRLSAFVRVAAQRADRNLDSSEKFSLGGPTAIRAYPTGEGNGDEGIYAQLELRVNAGALIPFAFYDMGTVDINARIANLEVSPPKPTRSVSGVGVGVRWDRQGWNAEALAAWPVDGGAAQAETGSGSPRVWMNLHYRFGAPR